MKGKKIIAALMLSALTVTASQVALAKYHNDSHYMNFKQSIMTDVELSFPVLKLNNEMATKNANKLISSYVHEAMYNMGGNSLVELESDYKVTYDNSDVVSVIFKKYEIEKYAAHGLTTKVGLVIDKNTGELVPVTRYTNIATVKDILNAIKSGKAKVYSSNMKEITVWDNAQSLDMAKTPSYFLDSRGNVCFYFPQGDLGPYSDGVTMVKILK